MGVSPTAEELALWQRRLAAHANNRAWTLAEAPSRSADEDEELLHAAHAAMHLWSIVGDARHRAHAALLLAHAHALLGEGSHAARYLAKAEPLLLASDAAGWERALTEAVGAGVAAAQGDAAAHRSRHQEAVRLAAALEDPDDRGVVEATLRRIPVPRA